MPCACAVKGGGGVNCAVFNVCQCIYISALSTYAVMNELSVPMNVVRIRVTVRHMSVSMSA